MYVCVCQAVSDSRIRREVREHGACTLGMLRERLGVASRCGRCASEARALINDTLTEQTCEAAQPCAPLDVPVAAAA